MGCIVASTDSTPTAMAEFAVVALPFARNWRTLHPSVARRLVLPGRGYGGTGAPDLGVARHTAHSRVGCLLGSTRLARCASQRVTAQSP